MKFFSNKMIYYNFNEKEIRANNIVQNFIAKLKKDQRVKNY